MHDYGVFNYDHELRSQMGAKKVFDNLFKKNKQKEKAAVAGEGAKAAAQEA